MKHGTHFSYVGHLNSSAALKLLCYRGLFQVIPTPLGTRWVTDFTNWELRKAPWGIKKEEKKEPSGLEYHLFSVRKWQQDKTKTLWMASDTTLQPGTSPAPHERGRCSIFFFFLKSVGTILINNLCHITANPWANGWGGIHFFPSWPLFLFFKHNTEIFVSLCCWDAQHVQ